MFSMFNLRRHGIQEKQARGLFVGDYLGSPECVYPLIEFHRYEFETCHIVHFHHQDAWNVNLVAFGRCRDKVFRQDVRPASGLHVLACRISSSRASLPTRCYSMKVVPKESLKLEILKHLQSMSELDFILACFF